MNIFPPAVRFSVPRLGKQNLVSLLLSALCFATSPQNLLASQDQDAPPQQQEAQQSPGQLKQLVAPIALYPDSLVSQILAASTYPHQVVEADRWVQAHPDLQGDALGQVVNQQPWDPSVKALTAFPSILGNMDKNLSWTSSLGDAYYNQQSDVMAAVQAMRQKAQAAGNLQPDPQETLRRKTRTSALSLPTQMMSTSPLTIRGWFTEIPLRLGRAGIRIPESGLAVRIFTLAPTSESVGTEVMDGAGIIGVSIGVVDPCSMTTTGSAPAAPRFIAGTPATGAALSASTAGRITTGPLNLPGRLTETPGLLEDTLNPAVKAVFARTPSVATTTAVRKGEPQSPIGPLVASAVAEGYAKGQSGHPTPYRGYYFHILNRQGKGGPGGAKAYIVRGKMTEGFAFVAYPAEYRSSGVMTFIVNEDGVVYQKDLGEKTDVLAKSIKKYNPDSSWQRAEGQQEETAGEPRNK